VRNLAVKRVSETEYDRKRVTKVRKIINTTLAILSPLAAVPTGWAIYAGVTEQPAFPMNPIAAIVGAVAVIATSVAAGLLVTDITAYNQGMKNKTEREELGMSTRPARLVFIGCVLAEIVLSLMIVVIPGALAFGVLVFPLMTAAGVFAFAVRFDLQQREASRVQLRASKKATAGKADVKPVKRAKVAPQVARKAITDDALLAYLASNPGESHQQVADHFGVSRQAVGQRVKKLYEVKK
jgi:hypothetical protein